MAVAKTYATYPQIGEPFKENGKMYINIQTLKTVKKVRWYSDAEYARMYPETKKDIMNFNAHHAFGFGSEGYITLYKGNVEEWINAVGRRNIYYNCTFLYYTPSGLTIPELIPGVIPVKLTWEEVQDYEDRMKSHEEVSAYVNKLLAMDVDSTSQYQGNKDEWLQKTITIRNKKNKDSHFGTKHTYTLEDAQGNIYIWETGAKDYNSTETVSLKMKVKEHKEVDGVKTTIVWYCKEV